MRRGGCDGSVQRHHRVRGRARDREGGKVAIVGTCQLLRGKGCLFTLHDFIPLLWDQLTRDELTGLN